MNAQPTSRLYAYVRNADQDAADPIRHPVIVVGAGPVGLVAALDLGLRGVPVVLLDDNDSVSTGSRAICFSKRTLEIAQRLGAGAPMVEKGVVWDTGKVFFGERQVYDFNVLPEAGHKTPAFVNLQQYYVEQMLVARIEEARSEGAPIEIRGRNRVSALSVQDDHVALEIDTPEGAYDLEADWLIACDGAGSPTREMMGLSFEGRVFEDNFLIADVWMEASFPTERWFWFDPPFNPGQSALLHKQPDGIWRIDLQLGWDIDKEEERKPERVIPRIKAMLGDEIQFSLEWVSIYTFQCRRMKQFRHGRVLFAGDSAHQVSPFGARGANSGIQDADNLGWKLAMVLDGAAPESLLDSYDAERIAAADENIARSTGSTDFITPKSHASRLFRDAALNLSETASFARPLINSGRLSTPMRYDASPLTSEDCLEEAPANAAPGCALPDAPLADGYLLEALPPGFVVLALGCTAPDCGLPVIKPDPSDVLAQRYLGAARAGIYLVRPDGHVAARWSTCTPSELHKALERAKGIV